MERNIKTFEQKRVLLIKKIIAAVILAAILVVAFLGIKHLIEKQQEQKYLETYGKAAVHVGENTVTYDIYRCLYLNYKDTLIADFTDEKGNVDTAALHSEIRKCVLNDIRNIYATVSLAADHGMSPTDGDVLGVVESYVTEMKTYYEENGLDFEADLEKMYLTESAFKFLESVAVLQDKLFTVLVSDGGVIEDNDEKVLEILRSDDFIRAKHIFIENDEGEDVENNRAIAATVIDEYKSGVSFDTLIGRFSEDYSMPYDGYYFTQQEAVNLEVGEISGVIESDAGFHILLRLPKDDEYLNNNFNDLKSQYQSITFNDLLEQRAARLTPVETDFVLSLSYEEIK